MKRRSALVWWALPLAYMGLIFLLSSLPLRGAPVHLFPMQDKGVHFIEFLGLGVVVAHAALKTWPSRALRACVFAALLGATWGLLDEFHQAFVPFRSADIWDFVADSLGASVGAGLRYAVHMSRGKSES